MCSLWERTAKQVCALWGTCNMPHAACPMPHAPCVAMIFVANERVSAARFLARSGRAKWSWKVRTIDDRLMDARTERGRDRQTEHTHTLRLRLRLTWTDSCDDADLSPHWHSHLCNYPRCTHTLRHTHRLAGKNISQSNRCPTCPTSSRACNYFLLNLHHMRNMSKT